MIDEYVPIDGDGAAGVYIGNIANHPRSSADSPSAPTFRPTTIGT